MTTMTFRAVDLLRSGAATAGPGAVARAADAGGVISKVAGSTVWALALVSRAVPGSGVAPSGFMSDRRARAPASGRAP